jgi:hypothetical protein
MLKRLASSYKLHQKILQTRQYAAYPYTQSLLLRQSTRTCPNKHFFSNSNDKFQFQSSIEEFQHLESVWQKYSEEGEQDEVWIKTLIAEPKIPTETYDQISSLRKEIGELIKLGNNKCAIGKAETYKNLISEFYIREHPANLSALNNIAIIKKGNNELNEAKGILY